MARKEFSKTVRVDRFKHCKGMCEKCGVRLSPGKFQYDHDIEDTFGGLPTFENCRVLCTACHTVKTSANAAIVAKTNAVRNYHIGAKPDTRRPIQSRVFEKKHRKEKLPIMPPKEMFR